MKFDIRSQRFAQRFAQRPTQRFAQLLWVLGCCVAFASEAHGQTLFARPDTTPKYPSYRNLEECITAVYRVTEEQENIGQMIWWDTVGPVQTKKLKEALAIYDGNPMTPRSDSATQAGRGCLSQFNADTASFKSYPVGLQIVNALLMARRDQDAQRFADRYLDFMRLKPSSLYKEAFIELLRMYTRSRPILVPESKKYHALLLAAVKGDSLYRSIDADLALIRVAKVIHDTVLFEELGMRAIHNNDLTPVEERLASPYSLFRLNALEGLVSYFKRKEGLDSLKISTLAYNMWRENTVRRRIWGGDPVTATDSAVLPYKVPDILGEYYYTATPGASPGLSRGTYTKHGAIPSGTLPVKGRINFITSSPSFCHSESSKRGGDNIITGSIMCYGELAVLRWYKELYPNLEITLLSDLYGHVGKLGPLQPAEEADTLASRYLGHFRVPGNLVMDNRPFFRLEEPDERRLDLLTPQMEDLGPARRFYKLSWFTDKEGYLIAMLGLPGDELFDIMYNILMNRPSK